MKIDDILRELEQDCAEGNGLAIVNARMESHLGTFGKLAAKDTLETNVGGRDVLIYGDCVLASKSEVTALDICQNVYSGRHFLFSGPTRSFSSRSASHSDNDLSWVCPSLKSARYSSCPDSAPIKYTEISSWAPIL